MNAAEIADSAKPYTREGMALLTRFRVYPELTDIVPPLAPEGHLCLFCLCERAAEAHLRNPSAVTSMQAGELAMRIHDAIGVRELGRRYTAAQPNANYLVKALREAGTESALWWAGKFKFTDHRPFKYHDYGFAFEMSRVLEETGGHNAPPIKWTGEDNEANAALQKFVRDVLRIVEPKAKSPSRKMIGNAKKNRGKGTGVKRRAPRRHKGRLPP